MVVVEARPFLFATEYTAMIILGIIMLIIVLGAMCWLLFNLAVFALPLFAAVSVGSRRPIPVPVQSAQFFSVS